MNLEIRVILSLWSGLLLVVSVGTRPRAAAAAERPPANPPAAEGQIEFSTLITAQSVTRHLASESGARDLAQRLRDIGIRRVWIEVVRSGHLVKSATLRLARDAFRAEGLIASAAMTTTWGPGFGVKSTGRHFLCYSAPETHQALAESARVAARIFDEIMYDDFLATHCRCDRCTREKGDRTWAEYRCELRSRVARRFIVEPIHEANSDAVVIIKYPQWYDRFHYYGYDVIRDTDSFDAIWVGTETRGADTPRFGYVPTYQSTIVYRWLSSIAGAKTRGGWFDVYDCTPDDYVDQAYSTVLAGATELMRFHAMDILPGGPHNALLVEFNSHRPHIEALARQIHGRLPLGLSAYKPAYSSAGDEEYFADFLGDLGVPINATAHFPTTRTGNSASVFLTRSALHDADIEQKVVEWSVAGGNVVATTGFLAGVSRDLHNLFGLQSVQSKPVDGVELQVDGHPVASPEPLALGGFLEPRTADVRLACRAGQQHIPILTAAKTGTGGFAVAINLRTHEGRDGVEGLLTEHPVTWLDLPDLAANRLRETVLDGTGLTMKGPSRVVVHALTGGLLVLINRRNTPTPVSLKLAPPWYSASGKELVIDPGGARVKPSSDGSFQLILPPRARWSLLLTSESL